MCKHIITIITLLTLLFAFAMIWKTFSIPMVTLRFVEDTFKLIRNPHKQ